MKSVFSSDEITELCSEILAASDRQKNKLAEHSKLIETSATEYESKSAFYKFWHTHPNKRTDVMEFCEADWKIHWCKVRISDLDVLYTKVQHSVKMNAKEIILDNDELKLIGRSK